MESIMDTTITVTIERGLWELFRPFYQDPEEAVKEIAVLELYRRRQISSGRAAELLGMNRFEFIRHAGRLGIPFFDLDETELAEELQQAGVGQ
jgi:predicted HTH domain antitoxin